MACSIPVIRPAGTSPVNFSGVTLFFSVQFGVGQKAEGFWPASLGATKIALDADAIRAVGGSVGAVVTTGLDTPAEVRVGFSLVSTAVARANVAKFAQLSFDEVAEASWRTWDNTLSRISIEDDASAPAAASGRNLFYSVLFHALRKPTDFTEQVFWTWACPPPPPPPPPSMSHMSLAFRPQRTHGAAIFLVRPATGYSISNSRGFRKHLLSI